MKHATTFSCPSSQMLAGFRPNSLCLYTVPLRINSYKNQRYFYLLKGPVFLHGFSVTISGAVQMASPWPFLIDLSGQFCFLLLNLQPNASMYIICVLLVVYSFLLWWFGITAQCSLYGPKVSQQEKIPYQSKLDSSSLSQHCPSLHYKGDFLLSNVNGPK